MSISVDQPRRYSLDEYHQLVESGVFDDDGIRAELIDGWLIEMAGPSREHDTATRLLMQWIVPALDLARFDVGVVTSLTLAPRSEPQPDLAVSRRGAPRPYHHSTALLVIEVSLSSLRHDLLIKARVYAGAGVPEYWVVDVEGRRVVRHLDPHGDVYRRIDEARDRLAATAVVLPPLDLRELFDAAFS